MAMPRLRTYSGNRLQVSGVHSCREGSIKKPALVSRRSDSDRTVLERPLERAITALAVLRAEVLDCRVSHRMHVLLELTTRALGGPSALAAGCQPELVRGQRAAWAAVGA